MKAAAIAVTAASRAIPSTADRGSRRIGLGVVAVDRGGRRRIVEHREVAQRLRAPLNRGFARILFTNFVELFFHVAR